MTQVDQELARARLAELRERAATVKAGDDDSPYEWTDEGEAEAVETLFFARYSQARTMLYSAREGLAHGRATPAFAG